MIATYIQELLANNNRVIVPNYGAFLVRATSKSKDANTLEEKLKDIYFSPFLKFNDELLEKYIVKKENITKEQAAEKIKQFIEDIKKELDADKKYEIKDFGHFEADKQGKVQFITITKEAEAPKETKAPVTKKSVSAKKPVTKEQAKVEVKAKLEEKPKPEESKAPATNKVEVKKEEKPESAGKIKEFKEEKKEAAQKQEEPKKEPTAQGRSIYSYKKEKKSVNKGLIWAIAIGVPVALVFIWALLNFNTVKKVFDKEKNKTEKVVQKKAAVKKAEVAKQETNTAQTEKKKQAKAQPEKQEVKPPPPQKKYYIIAGSFKNEKYANTFLTKLKAEGYNAEKLAERNGMHAVSYNSFTDKRKAIAEYKFLAQEKGLQTWILYY